MGIDSITTAQMVTAVNSPELQQLSVVQSCTRDLDEAAVDDRQLSAAAFFPTCQAS